jgi:2-C-methyl-D-erythritol 4-phosphate cytidylyltransferase
MNIAVLLAGGSGKRMGSPEPKQFIELAGRTILEHSIRAFHQHSDIDAIIIIAHADYIDRVQQISAPYPKVRHILPGGKERYDSTIAALRCVEQHYGEELGSVRLLIHDAVRPLVSHRIISDCILALATHRAIDVAIAATDTIVEVDAAGHICRIPPRASLRNVQTPQCFHYSVIAEAYRRGLQDPDFITTDDCGVVHRYMPEEPIFVVAGEPANIKLTYPEDLVMAEKHLQATNSL